MKFSPLVPLGTLLLVSSAFAAPKAASRTTPKIEPRAEQILKRAEAAYGSFRSFSVTATSTEKMEGQSWATKSRIKASLQWPERAAVARWGITGSGKEDAVFKTLVTSNSYISSFFDKPASIRSIADVDQRKRTIKADWIDNMGGTGFNFGVVSLAIPGAIAPANGEPHNTSGSLAKAGILRRLSSQSVRQGKRVLQKVTIVLAPPKYIDKGTEQTLEYYFAPETYFLEKLTVRGYHGFSRSSIVAQFSKPVSNWRGSQSVTDAAIYNWNSWAPGVPLPAAPPEKVVTVDPKALQIFERASDYYSPVKGLSLEWKSKVINPNLGENQESTVALDLEVGKKMRLSMSLGLEALIVIDGKKVWRLDTSNTLDGGPAQYKSEALEAEEVGYLITEELQLGDMLTANLSSWLEGKNPLAKSEVDLTVDGNELLTFKANVLPPEELDGKKCDLVRITTQKEDKYTTAPGITTTEQTFWFASGEGSVLRIQSVSVEGKQKSITHDIQVLKTELNPVFKTSTFVFTPPKGAVKK